jgi:dipeptidyl-peptidase-4
MTCGASSGRAASGGCWWILLKLSSGKELSEAEKMQRERQRIGDLKGIVSYEWAPDGKAVLVPLDGDLFLAGLDGSVRRIPGTQGGELNPKLGPKGDRIAYVRDRRLWVGAVAGQGAPVAVTPAESAETVHWGEAEFVAQEEMSRFAGFWWSPDESRLAVERFDEAKVGVVTRAAIGAEGTKTFDQRYPAAGTPNAEVSLWIMAPDGSGRVAVDLGAGDRALKRTSTWLAWTGHPTARRSMSSAKPRADPARHAGGRSRHGQGSRAVQ